MTDHVGESSSDEDPKKSDQSLPVLHKLAIQGLPVDMVEIIIKGLEAGKSEEEIKQEVQKATKKDLESN